MTAEVSCKISVKWCVERNLENFGLCVCVYGNIPLIDQKPTEEVACLRLRQYVENVACEEKLKPSPCVMI